MKEFQTNKSNLTESRQVPSKPIELSNGEIHLKVDRFAFTATTYPLANAYLATFHQRMS